MMKDPFCGKSRVQMMLLLSVLVIIDFFIIFVTTESTTVVHTTSGPIRGEILTTQNSVKYAAFKGIRYAKPPIGYQRFKPPVPVDPWNEILNAVSEGDDCPQLDPKTGHVKGSEDCLFINVFTPVTNLQCIPEKLKSVMVYIHGGGFVTGTSSSSKYNPNYILEKDVVYVSLNYRVGAFGFLSVIHPNATGNAGLKDQNLALKWVKANIERFGGNPKNVTIFGESAGSPCVGYQVLSHASAGLFHGAISMSGVPLNTWPFQKPEQALCQSMKLGALLGTYSTNKKTLLETFYRATAAEIVTATSHVTDWLVPPFAPTLEDESIATDAFLSECSVTKYKTGNYNKVPQMVGFMDQETIFWLGNEQQFMQLIPYCIDIAKKIGMSLPPGLRIVQNLINSNKKFYNQLDAVTMSAVINETSDLLFIAQIDQTQKLLAATNGKPVYYYHVSFHTNRSRHNIRQNNTLQGPAHADELAYIFYDPALNYSTDPKDPTACTIHRFTTMWTNFAKYGNPTPNWINNDSPTSCKICTWPDSGPSGISLNIGTKLTVEPRPIRAFARLIQSFSEPLLETTNGCMDGWMWLAMQIVESLYSMIDTFLLANQ